ncbi:hypothetical protein Dda_2490 [Drechslerella dactyloides]|uniref:Uncharacterized protein n=1 Tax=Drechslerella dactyloides TaxID=74499 RepID=A0AAD6J0I4_DREDA|nr:hypothetical protein Dda_2490 [Drechslerella dactyloides]
MLRQDGYLIANMNEHEKEQARLRKENEERAKKTAEDLTSRWTEEDVKIADSVHNFQNEGEKFRTQCKEFLARFDGYTAKLHEIPRQVTQAVESLGEGLRHLRTVAADLSGDYDAVTACAADEDIGLRQDDQEFKNLSEDAQEALKRRQSIANSLTLANDMIKKTEATATTCFQTLTDLHAKVTELEAADATTLDRDLRQFSKKVIAEICVFETDVYRDQELQYAVEQTLERQCKALKSTKKKLSRVEFIRDFVKSRTPIDMIARVQLRVMGIPETESYEDGVEILQEEIEKTKKELVRLKHHIGLLNGSRHTLEDLDVLAEKLDRRTNELLGQTSEVLAQIRPQEKGFGEVWKSARTLKILISGAATGSICKDDYVQGVLRVCSVTLFHEKLQGDAKEIWESIVKGYEGMEMSQEVKKLVDNTWEHIENCNGPIGVELRRQKEAAAQAKRKAKELAALDDMLADLTLHAPPATNSKMPARFPV